MYNLGEWNLSVPRAVGVGALACQLSHQKDSLLAGAWNLVTTYNWAENPIFFYWGSLHESS